MPITPTSSSPPGYVIQPDHFYGASSSQVPRGSNADPSSLLDPTQDPLATRGIPVFKPTMEEFQDFESYITKIECWGSRSGIVKVIPPQEWTNSLPSIKGPLNNVKIKSPIEQHMLGRGGLFRQENIEKRKVMSVREWVELCSKEEYRAPGVGEVGLHARAVIKPITTKSKKGRRKAMQEGRDTTGENTELKGDDSRMEEGSPDATVSERDMAAETTEATKLQGSRGAQGKATREAQQADRHLRDSSFVETFEPHSAWLPPNTTSADYTPEFCQKLERQYWRNCGLGKPAWYGADSQGSLYSDETKVWNVAHLESTLSRLLPASNQGLPGVNTPYLYFGMWRATFAWHVEDMDLFSINYIHFGAPKFWYSVPQGRATALERTMRSYFPKDTSQCPQFLRHKSFLTSPSILAQNSCKPNHLVQHAGEFVITFPRGYHAGFNLGLNCAESVNFALDSWLELGKKAQVCECIPDSVRIDVDQLLQDRAEETECQKMSPSPGIADGEDANSGGNITKKRTSDANADQRSHKRLKIKPPHANSTSSALNNVSTSPRKPVVTLKLGPKPERETYPCCLCVSTSKEDLLRVYEPPVSRKDAIDAAGDPQTWLAHEQCADIIPETWVDEVRLPDGKAEKVVFGVDSIVKDRWNLKCTACTKIRAKAHGAPIQCTKGKCPKAFHVSCARDGANYGIVFNVLREVEKEVVLVAPSTHPMVQNGAGAEQVLNVGEHADSQVLKIVKKAEVQALCNQHNPAIAAAKRASKQDKIKNELLALPSMSRIKIRVSAGVFEVSLIRVNEELGSVEVLWDRGVTREFKWGSVIFGNTDGPVQQKPTEMLACGGEGVHMATGGSVQVLPQSGTSTPASVDPKTCPPAMTSYLYPAYWPYQAPGIHPYSSPHMQYAYNSYYVTPRPDSSNYNPYAFYRGPWQWQKPYQESMPQASGGQSSPSDSPSGQPPTPPSPVPDNSVTSVSEPSSTDTASPGQMSSPTILGDSTPGSQPPTAKSDLLEMLNNPQLRDLVLSVVEQTSLATVTSA